MRNIFKWVALAVFFLLFSCTHFDEFGYFSFGIKHGVQGNIAPIVLDDEPGTKATINPSTLGYRFEVGDYINVWSNSGTLLIYTVQEVTNEGTGAKFSGGGFTLTDGETYHSSLPLIKTFTDNFHSLGLTYEGQVQVADNDADHCADYTYTYASTTCNNGDASFSYERLNAYMMFKLTLPDNLTLTELQISVDDDSFFALNGTADIATGSFTAGDVSGTMTLKLGGNDGIQVTDGVLNAFLAVAPCAAGEYVIRLKDSDGNTYTSPKMSKTALTAGHIKLFETEVYEGVVVGVAKIGNTVYPSLSAAVAAVPTDGTETTITMIGDEIIIGNSGVTISSDKKVKLDLNGKTISQTGPMTGTSWLIKNNGTLTILDSSDSEQNGTGKGKMVCSAEDPDTGVIPGYATNLISNYGVLNIESGFFQELTNAGFASFVVDNYNGGTTNISGGKLCNVAEYAYVVRMFMNSTSMDNVLNISGTAIIEGSYSVWMQYANSNANKGTLNISGGTLNASDGRALYAGAAGGNSRNASNVNVSISGGTINGTGAWLGADNAFNSISVTGGYFADFGVGPNGGSKFVTGGVYESVSLFFQNRLRENTIVADGYKVVLDGGLYYVVENSDPREAVDIYPANLVYYYWIEDGERVGGLYDFYSPFDGSDDAILMDGEFIELQCDINMTKDVTYAETCSWGDPIYAGGTFGLTFGEYDIDLNGYKFPIPTGVTIKTDKQTNIFSALEVGYTVVETAISEDDFHYQYTVASPVAIIGNVEYLSLAAAVAAAQANDVITLIADDNISLTDGSEITIDKPLTITGGVDSDGKPLYTIFGKPDGTGNYNDIYLACATGTVTVSNVKFDGFGNQAASANGRAPVFVGSSNNNTVISNVYFSNLNCEAVHINGGTFTVQDCNIDCTKTAGTQIFTRGICAVNSASGSILRTEISGVVGISSAWTGAIEFNGNGTFVVSDCTLQASGNYGMGLVAGLVPPTQTGGAQVTMSNTTIIVENYGIYSDGDYNALTSISSGSYSGLMVVGDNGEGLAISGGVFEFELEDSYCAEGYIPADNIDPDTMDDYPYTVRQGSYVAQIGDVKYGTFAEVVSAAQSGATITLLADYDLSDEQPSGGYNRLPINKNLTIDGNNHILTVKGRGLAPGMDASSKVDVTFKNITIENASAGARCIDTRGNIGTLTLDNVTLSTEGASGYTQPLTIGGNQSDAATVSITNSTIQTNGEGTAYYAIITFNPVNMSVSNSTLKGWACIYAKGADGSAGSAGSVFTLSGCTLESMNNNNGESNSFAALMLEDDNVHVGITSCSINIHNSGDQNQSIVGANNISYTSNVVSLGEGNVVSFDNTGTGSCGFSLNSARVVISGGTFNENPTDFVASGYHVVEDTTSQPGHTIYTVVAD